MYGPSGGGDFGGGGGGRGGFGGRGDGGGRGRGGGDRQFTVRTLSLSALLPHLDYFLIFHPMMTLFAAPWIDVSRSQPETPSD